MQYFFRHDGLFSVSTEVTETQIVLFIYKFLFFLLVFFFFFYITEKMDPTKSLQKNR